jgi:RimJ/RimL family protein N-acetyltransferase
VNVKGRRRPHDAWQDAAMVERVELLGPGDEERLDRFLALHSDSSMFLRSNWRAEGLADRGGRLQGTYAARVVDGEVVGVAAHYGNGMIALQAPEGRAGELAGAAVRATGREVRGIVGPSAQVEEARAALGWTGVAAAVDSREDLFALELEALVVPELLVRGGVRCARAGDEDVARASEWRVAYSIEALGSKSGAELEREARASIEGEVARGVLWMLREAGGAVVAMSAFNARLPDRVQVGGVYTPPELRGRGYAGAVVAGQLLDVREEGVVRAVLFTQADNHAARRAYQRIGFELVGDYGLLLFAAPIGAGGAV